MDRDRFLMTDPSEHDRRISSRMLLLSKFLDGRVLGTHKELSMIKRRVYLTLVLLGGILVAGVIIELANGSFFSKPRI